MRAFFGGWSAGAYGTMYNYHWLVDDLQWPRTTAFPDAGMGLDNGEPIGVRALGLLKIPLWGAQPNLPPYCFEGDCAVGTDLFDAISPRLKQVPEQQFLVMTNPRDRTQQFDAYFSDEANGSMRFGRPIAIIRTRTVFISITPLWPMKAFTS